MNEFDKLVLQYKRMNDKCPSCGVPWLDHLGMTGTCAKLQRLLTGLEMLIEQPGFGDWERKQIEDLLKEVTG